LLLSLVVADIANVVAVATVAAAAAAAALGAEICFLVFVFGFRH